MRNGTRERIVVVTLAKSIRPETLAAVCNDLIATDSNAESLSDCEAANVQLLLSMLLDQPAAMTDRFKRACFGTTDS